MDIQMSKDLNAVFNILTSPTIAKYSNTIMCYVCLFEVTPYNLKAPKFRKIMEEMKRLFDAGTFSFQKKTYSISQTGIAEALDLCIKKNFDQSLENHNYLKKVMITIAEREAKGKSIQADMDLRRREEGNFRGDERPDVPILRGPIYPGDEEVKPGKLTPAEIKANQQRAREIVDSLVISKEIKGKSI
jgi:hypothetical protein